MKSKPVTHPDTGVSYPSRAALARALGVTRSAVCLALRDGWLHRLGTGRGASVEAMNAARRQPVAALGWRWASQRDCARALGVADSTVCDALAEGRLDRLVNRILGPARRGRSHAA